MSKVKIAQIILFASLFLLGLGVSVPCLRVTTSIVGGFDSIISAITGSDFNKAQEKSVINILGSLFSGGEMMLFWLILIFSILFPVAKIVVYLFRVHAIQNPSLVQRNLGKITDKVSKFSMTDVFVISLLLVSMKSSSNLNVEVMAGTYCFAGSVILTFIAQLIISKLKSPTYSPPASR